MSVSSSAVTRLQTRSRSEDGFSLMELVVVVVVMAVVLIALFASLDTFTKSTSSLSHRAVTLTEVRHAVETMSRDLRAAAPIRVQSPVSSYDTKVSFTTYCATAGTGNCDATNRRTVTYEVVDNELRRTVGSTTGTILVPRGPSSVPISEQAGAIVNDVSIPVFRYIKRDGTVLSTTGGTPATTFRDCVKQVEIRLVVVPEARQASRIDLVTRVALRNYNEVSAC